MTIITEQIKKIPIILFSLILPIITISSVQAYEGTEIFVTMVGNSEYNLDEDNRLIRASVEVIDYDPRDGFFYMQIIQPGTGKIIRESEILMTERGNDLWGAEIAGMLDDEKIIQNGKVVQGDYQLKILSQFGSASGSTTFSIIKPSEKTISNIQESNQEQLQVNQTETNTEIDNEQIESNENKLELKMDDEPEPSKIPDWVKNIALWYGQGSVSEDEFINAIKFLIDQGILKV